MPHRFVMMLYPFVGMPYPLAATPEPFDARLHPFAEGIWLSVTRRGELPSGSRGAEPIRGGCELRDLHEVSWRAVGQWGNATIHP
jgi:hypothetical protein